jgi:SprT-like family
MKSFSLPSKSTNFKTFGKGVFESFRFELAFRSEFFSAEIKMVLSKVYSEVGLGLDLFAGLYKLSCKNFNKFQRFLQIPSNSKFFVKIALVFEHSPSETKRQGVDVLGRELLQRALSMTRNHFESLDFYKTWSRVERSKGYVGSASIKPDFLLELSESYPLELCRPSVRKFRTNLAENKGELVEKLMKYYDRTIFGGVLYNKISIKFNGRIRTAWGWTRNFKTRSLRTSKVDLATKVCIKPEHYRDTLIHEVCHCAVHIISKMVEADDHGPIWSIWCEVSMRILPTLPFIVIEE